MCPEVRPLMELEGHLAEHLQSISLFVLGANIDADDDEESGKSGSAAISEVSSQLLSHPSDSTRGSQGSPGILLSGLSEFEEDLEPDTTQHDAPDSLQDDARPYLTLPRRRSSTALKKAEMKAELQRWIWFENGMQKAFRAPSGYVTVAVLAIRWHEAVDPDKEGHDKEVRSWTLLKRHSYNCQT